MFQCSLSLNKTSLPLGMRATAGLNLKNRHTSAPWNRVNMPPRVALRAACSGISRYQGLLAQSCESVRQAGTRSSSTAGSSSTKAKKSSASGAAATKVMPVATEKPVSAVPDSGSLGLAANSSSQPRPQSNNGSTKRTFDRLLVSNRGEIAIRYDHSI